MFLVTVTVIIQKMNEILMKKYLITVLIMFIIIGQAFSWTKCYQWFDGPVYCYSEYIQNNTLYQVLTKDGEVIRFKKTKVYYA